LAVVHLLLLLLGNELDVDAMELLFHHLDLVVGKWLVLLVLETELTLKVVVKEVIVNFEVL
jgi:hypothetical protein